LVGKVRCEKRKFSIANYYPFLKRQYRFLKNEFLAKLLSLLKRENLRTKTEESIKQFLLLLKTDILTVFVIKFTSVNFSLTIIQ